MYFKENLRYLRRSNHMSQDKLAELLGYKSYTTIQKWEDGTAFPIVENLNKIADIFNISLDHLLNHNIVANKTKVPIVGEVKAGYNLYANEEILGYEYVNNGECEAGEYFYLKVKGDSMINDRIMDGDEVYVKKQDYLNNNEIGVFLIVDNDEVTIKRINISKDGITLKASNPKYQDRFFKYGEVKILGKVIHNKIKY